MNKMKPSSPVDGIGELSFEEIDSVNGGELTGDGIAAGIGTFVGGLGGTYFGIDAVAFALAPGLAAGAVGAVAFAIAAYAIYRTAEGLTDNT